MKNIIKLGLILGLFAVVSCALLAVVNNFTAPVIKKLEAEKEQQALKMVLPSASQYIAADSETVMQQLLQAESILDQLLFQESLRQLMKTMKQLVTQQILQDQLLKHQLSFLVWILI